MRFCVLLFCGDLLGTTHHVTSSEATTLSQVSGDEHTLWNLERAYWRYVETNDLVACSDLWHKDFLGPRLVPRLSAKITLPTGLLRRQLRGSGSRLATSKPAGLQVTGDIAFACYWITFRWVDKDGNGAPHTMRITHAWVRGGKNWQIVGGMSMPEAENPEK
jgi:hypothetical protein